MIISSLLWNKGDTTIKWQSPQGNHEIKLSAPLGHLIILSDKSGFLAIEDTEKSDPNNASIWNSDGSMRCKLSNPLAKDSEYYKFYYSEYISGRLHCVIASIEQDFRGYVDELTCTLSDQHESR